MAALETPIGTLSPFLDGSGIRLFEDTNGDLVQIIALRPAQPTEAVERLRVETAFLASAEQSVMRQASDSGAFDHEGERWMYWRFRGLDTRERIVGRSPVRSIHELVDVGLQVLRRIQDFHAIDLRTPLLTADMVARENVDGKVRFLGLLQLPPTEWLGEHFQDWPHAPDEGHASTEGDLWRTGRLLEQSSKHLKVPEAVQRVFELLTEQGETRLSSAKEAGRLLRNAARQLEPAGLDEPEYAETAPLFPVHEKRVLRFDRPSLRFGLGLIAALTVLVADQTENNAPSWSPADLLAMATAEPRMVRLTSKPPGAWIAAPADGEILGREPMWVAMSKGQSAEVMFLLEGRTPTRVWLPTSGQMDVFLPVEDTSLTSCRVDVSGSSDRPVSVPVAGFAIHAAPSGSSLGLVCPDYGGKAHYEVPAQGDWAVLILVPPEGKALNVDGAELGSGSLRIRTRRSFVEVQVVPGGPPIWVPAVNGSVVKLPDRVDEAEPGVPGKIDAPPKTEAQRNDEVSGEGIELLLSGQDEKAYAFFRECLRRNPRDGHCHLGMGMYYRRTGNFGRARQHLESYLRWSPKEDRDRARVERLLKTNLRMGRSREAS
jgi:hypothetical protein